MPLKLYKNRNESDLSLYRQRARKAAIDRAILKKKTKRLIELATFRLSYSVLGVEDKNLTNVTDLWFFSDLIDVIKIQAPGLI
jgi:hypothetical protein